MLIGASLYPGESELHSYANSIFPPPTTRATSQIDNGADLQFRDAVRNGDRNLMQHFIDNGSFNINWIDTQNGYSYLHYAAESGGEGVDQLVQLLIDGGINYTWRDRNGQTAFAMLHNTYRENGGTLPEGTDFSTVGNDSDPTVRALAAISNAATERLTEIFEQGNLSPEDWSEIRNLVNAGASLEPLTRNIDLFDVINLAPGDRLRAVRHLLDNGAEPNALYDGDDPRFQGMTASQYWSAIAADAGDTEGAAEANEIVALLDGAVTNPEDPSADPEDPSAEPEDPTAEDPEDPTADPEDPTAEDPEDPSVDPEDPSADPEDPAAEPEDPSADPEDPAADPEDPSADPEDPSAEPEDPTAEDPEDPSAEPEDPTAEDPEDPSADPEDPAADPEDPSAEPEAPTAEDPEDPSADPEDPSADPEDPSADPEDPTAEDPEDPSADPEDPAADPEDPTADPEDPSADPEDPTAEDPEDPSADPEDPSADPEDPTAEDPEDPSADPEDPAADPEDPTADPEDPSADPEDPAAEPEDPSADPEDPTAEPEDPTADPEDPSADPEDPAAEPEDPTAEDPEDPTADPEDPSAEPEDPTADPEDPTADPEDPAAEPEDPTAEDPEDPSADPEDPTAEDPEDPSADPEDPTADPEDPSAEPEDPTAEPEDPTADPEGPTAEDPEDPSADPEDPSADPEDPSAEPEDPTAEDPEDPAADPEDPTAEDPEDPTADPEDPTAEDPEDPSADPEDPSAEPEDPAADPEDPTAEDPEDPSADPEDPAAEPDEIIEEFPLLDELNILEMDTTFTDAEGNPLSVGEATMQILFDQWREGIENGTITSDDPRYRAYYATQAALDLENGRVIVPYHEYGWSTSETWEGDPVYATPEDMEGLYNPENVQQMLDEAWADPVVMQELQDAQNQAIDSAISDRDAMRIQIEEMLLSADFRNYLDTLRWQGNESGAMDAMMIGIQSYGLVATEEEVNEVMQELGMMDVLSRFEVLLDDLENMDIEYLEGAVLDWATTMLRVLHSGLQAIRHSLSSLRLLETTNFLENLMYDRDYLRSFSLVTQNLMSNAPELLDRMSPDELMRHVNTVMDERHIPLEQRNGLSRFLGNLHTAGVLGTTVGTLGLVGSIYRMTNGEAFGDNHILNMEIARGFLLFVGTATDWVKLGATLTDRFPEFARLMGAGNTSAIFASRNLQQIFSTSAPSPWTQAIVDTLDAAPVDDLIDNIPENRRTSLQALASRFSGALDSRLGTRFAAAFVRVLDGAANVGFGAVDLAIGAIRLRNGIRDGNNWDIALGSLQVISGSFATVAGVGMLFSTFGFASASWFIAPLLLPAAILGGISVFIEIFRYIFREDDMATINQREYFRNVANLGLLQENWGDRVAFLVHSFYGDDRSGRGINNQRPNTPEGVSVFDHYDWERWIDEYNARHDEHYSLPDGPPPMYPDTPISDAMNTTLEEMAQYYRDYYENQEDPSRTVPTLGNEYLRTRFEQLVEYYYLYSIDPGNPPTPEQAAEWAWDRLTRELQRSLGGLELPGGNGELNPANQEIVSIMDNHWGLHGGNELAYEIANEVVAERGLGLEGLYPEFTGLVDSLVDIYRNGINTENRTIPAWSNSDVNQLWRDIFRYYYTYINPNGNSHYIAGPDQGDNVAVDWAMRHILSELREIDPALENILWRNYTVHDGWRDAIQIANEVLAELYPNAPIHPVPA